MRGIQLMACHTLARKANEHFGYSDELNDQGLCAAPILAEDVEELVCDGESKFLKEHEVQWILSVEDIFGE